MRRLPPKGLVLRAFCVLVAVWLMAPVLIVVPLAFAGAKSFVFPPESWSLQWFDELVTDSDWRDALLTSARVALLTVVVAAVLGTAAALGLQRARIPGASVIRGLLVAPMVVPVVITAVGVYAVFLPRDLLGTDLGFVLAHSVLAVPFVLVAVSTSLAGVDRRLEQAAASLGASPATTFFTATLPLIRPGLLAGSVFAFIASFDELVVSLFLASPLKSTLPVQMYESLEEVNPTIAAASTLFLVVTTAVMCLALFLNRSDREHGLA
jgi:putative spermidine/putrescine transport system permease protein